MAEPVERSISIDPNAQIDIKRASSRDPQREPRSDNLNILNTHLLKLHASFKREDDGSVYIRDQYLTFGTVLNGKVLSPRFWFPVVLGDVLQLIILKPSVFIRRRLEGSTAQALDLSEFGNSQTALVFSIELKSGNILSLKPSEIGSRSKNSVAFDVSKVHPVLTYDGAELSAWGLAEGAQLDKFSPELDDSGAQITDDLDKSSAVIAPGLDGTSEDAIEVVLIVNEPPKSTLGAVYHQGFDDDDKDWNGDINVQETYHEESGSECSEDSEVVDDYEIEEIDEIDEVCEKNVKLLDNGKDVSRYWCSSQGTQAYTCGNEIITNTCECEEEEEEEEEEEDPSENEEDVDEEEDSYDDVDEDEDEDVDAYEVRDVGFDIHFDDYDCNDYDEEYEAVLDGQSLCVCRKRTFSERDDEDVDLPEEGPDTPLETLPTKKARLSTEGIGAVLKAVGREVLRGSFYAVATIVALGIYGLSTD